MKNSKELFPIQLLTKIAAVIAAIGAFVGLAYYFSEQEYIFAFVSFLGGVLTFGVLMTIAKIADNIDYIKELNSK
jgi:hypothetical protein